MIDITREGNVFIVTMNAGENRFNPAFLEELSTVLDEIENAGGPAAMVTTGGTEKFYSNGLDLAWMTGDGASDALSMVADVLRLLGRLLEFPVPSVAAMNGHAFAGGGMLATAHDFRVMRLDRGYFCLPEVDLAMPLADGMTALLQAKLRSDVLRDLVLTGRRIGGAECVALGVVDEAVDADRVLPRAIERADALSGKSRGAYRALKRGMYAEAIAVLNKAEVPA